MSKTSRTVKQRQFLKYYIESKGNASYAYKKINPNASPKSIASNASKYLEKCQPNISELLDKLGLDDFMLIRYLSDGISAKKKIKDGDGELVEVEDWSNRARFLEMAFKMKGKYSKDTDAEKDRDKPRKAAFVKTYEFKNPNKIKSKAN